MPPNFKNGKNKKISIQHNVDIVGLSEVNKDWRRVKQDNIIWNTTKNWREHRKVQVSQNATRPPDNSEFLIDGTAMVAFDDMVFNISDQGKDEYNLGRRSYISINGKNDVITIFITCYCPARSSSTGSNYSQQLIYIAENRSDIPTDTVCPRQLYGEDLKN